ncbi:class A beta-lactamase-related serine hydrolase [Nocardia brasiliensis]|uniref:class A beta-lactamase-related serine hydrolase n=1 Tax=Nocardia brasiliensis TaxID=37326 RepID=UPI00245732A5|nr:class A beta-lactamase-related serine hydrolase [Nocardia brasiliensis]
MSVLSIYAARLGEKPIYATRPDVPHDAASTVKAAVLAALYRSGSDLNTTVLVHDRFLSRANGQSFANSLAWDSDPIPWQRLGGRASLWWLADRMITSSSNLATNLCLEHIGLDPVSHIFGSAGVAANHMDRFIEDYPARDLGLTNQVTARGLATLFLLLRPDELSVLARNRFRGDLPTGLPPDTPIAFKNGWFPGLRHSVGLITPSDSPPYALAICYTGPIATGRPHHDPAASLLARISTAIWHKRHDSIGIPAR